MITEFSNRRDIEIMVPTGANSFLSEMTATEKEAKSVQLSGPDKKG